MSFTDIGAAVGSMRFHFPSEAEVEAQREADRNEALAYLHSKGWTEATLDDVTAWGPHTAMEIIKAKRQELACEKCRETGILTCPTGRVIPVICRSKDAWGRVRYDVPYTHCPVRMEKVANETPFDRLLSYSRLSEKQRGQTFEAFNRDGVSLDVRRARLMAMGAAEDGAWLTLGGRRGAGKSHLAAAIAIEVMRKKGQQAYFRLVSEMLDDLRHGYDDGEHDAQMSFLKEVPCLILDDLGKERSTPAACDFLYQIIDARYRERRQVIVTTNAMSKEEMVKWGDKADSNNASFLAPLISRMDEMGDFVFISDAEDYRARLGRERRASIGKAVA